MEDNMQEEDKITIFDVYERVSRDSLDEDSSPTRAWQKGRVQEFVLGTSSEIAADQLERNMKRFLSNLHKMIAESAQLSGEYELDTVEVSASISGKGQIGIIGSGLSLKGKGGITFTFKRRRSG
jgi:hypothetical protein